MPAEQERTLDDLTALAFDGLAVWNARTEELNLFVSGQVPRGLRFSLDKGQTWTLERVFQNQKEAPEEIWLDDSCQSRLRVFAQPKLEDCRMLSDSELESARIHGVFSSALAAEEAVYRLNLKQRFQGEWDLLLSFGCLQMLSLDSNQVADVPESIGNLTQLRSLGLGDNQLTDVPESIGNLTQLRSLGLGDNQLTDVPESIGNLTQLQTLDLRSNQLTDVPESIGNLTQLQTLRLYSNQLTDVPEWIGNLTQLQTLWLHGNQLTDVPESIGNLTQLQSLDLRNNQLTDVPESIGNLTQLQELWLDGNQLTDLPESIGNLTQLQWLNLRGNPIPVQRRAAIQALLPNTTIIWD